MQQPFNPALASRFFREGLDSLQERVSSGGSSSVSGAGQRRAVFTVLGRRIPISAFGNLRTLPQISTAQFSSASIPSSSAPSLMSSDLMKRFMQKYGKVFVAVHLTVYFTFLGSKFIPTKTPL